MSLKVVPKDHINNILALAKIMTWHRSREKPLSESMMVILLGHICFTRRKTHTIISHALHQRTSVVPHSSYGHHVYMAEKKFSTQVGRWVQYTWITQIQAAFLYM